MQQVEDQSQAERSSNVLLLVLCAIAAKCDPSTLSMTAQSLTTCPRLDSYQLNFPAALQKVHRCTQAASGRARLRSCC